MLNADQVEWVVNDMAELGVKIGNQFFWLYKGCSIDYGGNVDRDSGRMKWRRVGKREFGECCHPIKFLMSGTQLPDRYIDELEFVPGLSDKTPEYWTWQYMPIPSLSESNI